MQTFILLLTTALKIKMAILGLPVEQQVILTPVIDNIVSEIQTELASSTPVQTTPIVVAPIEPTLPVTSPQNFGGTVTAPIMLTKELTLKVGDKWGTQDNDLVRNIIIKYTENGKEIIDTPITVSTDSGIFTNYSGNNVISENGSTIVLKTRNYGLDGIGLNFVLRGTATTTMVTAEANGVTKTVSF